MKRVVILLLLVASAVYGVSTYNRQRAGDAIKRQMLDIVSMIDCDEVDRNYLSRLVLESHSDVVDGVLGVEGRHFDKTTYLKRMFNRLLETAKADGKAAELITTLERSRDANVTVSKERI